MRYVRISPKPVDFILIGVFALGVVVVAALIVHTILFFHPDPV